MKFLDSLIGKIIGNFSERTPPVIKLEGIDRVGFCFVSAYLHSILRQCDVLIVTENAKEQEEVYNEFITWQKLFNTNQVQELDNSEYNEPLFFAAWDVLPDDGRLPGVDSLSDRLTTIARLARNIIIDSSESLSFNNSLRGQNRISCKLSSQKKRGNVVIASSISLLQRTLSPDFLIDRTFCLKVGDKVNMNQISQHLIDSFYEPVAKVSEKGEFSIRGGILDVFPLISEQPVRIEFFGDLIDSMRVFDPVSQISMDSIQSVLLPPAGEFAIIKNVCRTNASENVIEFNYSHLKKSRAGENAPESFVNTSSIPDFTHRVLSSTLLKYFDRNTIVIFYDAEEIEKSVNLYYADSYEDEVLYCSWEEILDEVQKNGMQVVDLREEISPFTPGYSIQLDSKSSKSDLSHETEVSKNVINNLPGFQSSMHEEITGCLDSLNAWRPVTDRIGDYQVHQVQTKTFFSQIQKWLNTGYTVLVICPQEMQFSRIKELWEEFGLEKQFLPDGISQFIELDIFYKQTHSSPAVMKTVNNKKLVFYQGSINRGFIIHDDKFVVISDAEIFGRIKISQPRSLKSKYRSQFFHHLVDVTELEEGDYVVHVNYGIGRFLGLTRLSQTPENAVDAEECLVIEYAPSKKGQEPPRLYVPVSEAHLVTKYIGTGRGKPILNKLSGKKWQKTKEKAENAIKDFAAELLLLQAERMNRPGFAFLPDTPWQHDFENAFEFEETPDQLMAILETKKDMESPKPMDRLVCGDAGYGKTEVALRAAFKAVMSGKQVAVLVPTTVLAQQHYLTFTSRMAAFPINICVLSRFKTKSEQKKLIQQIAVGGIDIVIGTHRILQGDVQFHDLGLIIIDEEQRFGVLHKEKLKFLKRQVDVLTLSATPIPRTLYLALMGARDMSIIETPPHDRLPIETIVARYDDNLVRDAIRRELRRNGQVFYLHNQIYDIDRVADKLKELVPEARIVVGHGRMPASKLEKVMSDFVSGKADILLSTTIVENGLDIPNANTIIIDRADRYGLSDLYQLRGRVGRYRRQAYAYLLIPRHVELIADARKRISAIKQYSSPGSGFKIAMRDLEIRGAGNILGVEQSGHIAAIGFHLYCQLLNQAIKTIKGHKPGIIKNVTVRLDFLITNPVQEIPDPRIPPAQKSSGSGKKPLFVPREVAYYSNDDNKLRVDEEELKIQYAPAYIPISFIEDYRQRTEIYRKIAQTSTIDEIAGVRKEIEDRFGRLPLAVEFFLKLEEIKILAAEKGITVIETEYNKLKICRNNDYLMINGKFPRLTKIKPEAKIKEIIHLLKSL